MATAGACLAGILGAKTLFEVSTLITFAGVTLYGASITIFGVTFGMAFGLMGIR